MQRQSWSLGCILLGLGALLSCCLLPYLVSSLYSIVTALLQVPGTPQWLWGTWIHALVGGESDVLYMLLAEGPICCVGVIGLLIVILGLVLALSGPGRSEEADVEGESGPYPETEERYPEAY
jgi:hypothetical protein